MRVYCAAPYTAKRETCGGCAGSTGRGPKGCEYTCNRLAAWADGEPFQPGDRCPEPNVKKRDANVARADEAGRLIARLGHTPFVPQKMTWDWERDEVLAYEDFLRIDLEWLGLCDALLYLGPSPGADRELEAAKAMGLTIYYSVDEIPTSGDSDAH